MKKSELKKQNQILKAQIDALNDSLAVAKTTIDEMKDRAINANTERSRFQREIKELKESLKINNECIETAERRMNELESKIFRQSQKIEQLKNDALAVAKHIRLVMNAQF